jgi:hypothetical protein
LQDRAARSPAAFKKEHVMKIAFLVHNEHFAAKVFELLRGAGIDYFTRWDQAIGKGHGTEPHLGRGSYASMNSVMMIAFSDEQPLELLIGKIEAANAEITRADDRIRLFQLPLERMV